MALLVQFLLRLTFGLAFGMTITSPKLVTSGYFRNHLYVTLGLAVLASLLSFYVSPEVFWYCVTAAIGSYLGAVYWLFEKPGPGKLMLTVVTLAALTGALCQQTIDEHGPTENEAAAAENSLTMTSTSEQSATKPDSPPQKESSLFFNASIFSSGLLLGITMAAMLLGHWYLNTPTMELLPLRRLIIAMSIAVSLQAVISTIGLVAEFVSSEQITLQWILFVTLRWTFGLVGVAAMAWMAWQTLKIPNTQSATGILYVAVIGTFVGETMALLLSTESLYPL